MTDSVLCLFFTVSWVGLLCVIEVFLIIHTSCFYIYNPDHTHLLFLYLQVITCVMIKYSGRIVHRIVLKETPFFLEEHRTKFDKSLPGLSI